MIPRKLSRGDVIRVVAPSCSLTLISDRNRALAEERLAELGLSVSYGSNVDESDSFDSSTIESRVADLHDAFKDPEVAGVLTVIGGHNVNQIISYLDYQLISRYPKPLCGFSDITALGNAIFAKTGLVTYSGPHFSSFAMVKGLEYTIQKFVACVMKEGPIQIEQADSWSDDRWYEDQENREFISNQGYLVINPGSAEGRIIGGNLCTLNLLQGTEFMPSLDDVILFIEDDYEVHPATFDRDLQSLIHQPGFPGVQGIVIGRFQKASNMSTEKLIKIIQGKKELSDIPVIAQASFGHTYPQFTFPIGGTARIHARKNEVSVEILQH